MSKFVRFAVGGMGALVLAGGAWQWSKTSAVTPAHAETREPRAEKGIRAEGRVAPEPGAEVVIGTDLGGTLKTVNVAAKAKVKKGDVLAELRAESERAALAEAFARVRSAEVDIKFFDSELGRSQRLVASGALPSQLLDKATFERDSALARRQVSHAQAARLDADLKKAQILSPIDGTILERHAEAGETVAPGSRLFTVADLDRVRVEVDLDEFDAANVHLGQAVAIRAEGYDTTWQGTIAELPDRVEPRALRPQDPGKPTDTRVLRVKVAPKTKLPLYLGQRVDVSILAK